MFLLAMLSFGLKEWDQPWLGLYWVCFTPQKAATSSAIDTARDPGSVQTNV